MTFAILNIIAFAFVIIGSINWGLVGIFDINLVSLIFGAYRNVGSIIIYILVFASALWLIFAAIYQRRKIVFCPIQTERLARNDYKTKKV